ncbi:MAG: rhomboid family intramembrane serine protease [Gammaproteobacteria bacterium]|nr:rhomboid family intramembrane serine protease [Gammaproteobacteria bacterium]
MAIIALAMSRLFLGPFEEAALANGAVIKNIAAGESWRILTGSFLHHNIQHWLINCVLLIFIVPLIAFYSMKAAVLCFFVGTLLSQVCYILFGIIGFHDHDLLVGFSGGIYALLAYLLLDTVLARQRYPHGFFILVTAFILLIFVGTELLKANASGISHASGFFGGALIFVCNFLIRRHRVGE